MFGYLEKVTMAVICTTQLISAQFNMSGICMTQLMSAQCNMHDSTDIDSRQNVS